MRRKNFTPERQRFDHAPSPTAMRAPLDYRHSLELTFNDGGETQYQIVNSDINNADLGIKEGRYRCSSEAAFVRMMKWFNLYERAIAVWLHSDDPNDGVKMRRVYNKYQRAVDG